MKETSAKKKSAKSKRNLPLKTLTSKQAKNVKGGASTLVPGNSKWEPITLKRGIT